LSADMCSFISVFSPAFGLGLAIISAPPGFKTYEIQNDCLRLIKGIERVGANNLVKCAVRKLEAFIQIGNLKLHIGEISAFPMGVPYHRPIDV